MTAIAVLFLSAKPYLPEILRRANFLDMDKVIKKLIIEEQSNNVSRQTLHLGTSLALDWTWQPPVCGNEQDRKNLNSIAEGVKNVECCIMFIN